MPVDAQTVIKCVQITQKFLETAPAVVNAANHIVTNGVRSGGYDIMKSAVGGVLQNGYSLTGARDIGATAFQGIQQNFAGSGSLTRDILDLGQNVKSRYVASKAAPTVPQLGTADAFNAVDDFNHAVTESASAATTALGSIGSAAAKGGAAGIVLGITMETLASFKKYQSGEITKEQYISEIAKSGGQMGITGAATAGIMTALSVPLATAGLAAAPITVPISFVLGKGIDKIVAPAFGRGDYAKILGECKYYQNLLYAHDDLVHAIGKCEEEFASFIDEYQRQLQVHAQLTDRNRQLSQLHKVADNQIAAQSAQINETFGSLGGLFDKI